MARPLSWRGEAHNPVPDSPNKIHSDEIARRHGFDGALVPGVTVTAYVCQPAVLAWGMEWLTRGRASVVVHKPVYDGRAFRVALREENAGAYEADLFDTGGTLCAVGTVDLPAEVPPLPRRRGDPLATDDRQPAKREGLESLRARGVGAMRSVWTPEAPIANYLGKPSAMPELLRPDGGAYANTSFLLGLTNSLLAANVALGPWLHLEARFQHFAPVANGSDLMVEGEIADLFEKKGHEFVDLDVSIFLGDASVLSARMRAIYKLRGS